MSEKVQIISKSGGYLVLIWWPPGPTQGLQCCSPELHPLLEWDMGEGLRRRIYRDPEYC